MSRSKIAEAVFQIVFFVVLMLWWGTCGSERDDVPELETKETTGYSFAEMAAKMNEKAWWSNLKPLEALEGGRWRVSFANSEDDGRCRIYLRDAGATFPQFTVSKKAGNLTFQISLPVKLVEGQPASIMVDTKAFTFRGQTYYKCTPQGIMKAMAFGKSGKVSYVDTRERLFFEDLPVGNGFRDAVRFSLTSLGAIN